MKNEIGFFGGTFDPVHFGHIQLVIALMETASLKKVLFCPTSISPFKASQPPVANGIHRLNMLKLALEGIPDVEIIEDEIHSSDPCYTIDTITRLKKNVYPNDTLRLLLSGEMIESFHLWKDYKKLIELAPPLVGSRSFKTQTNHLNVEKIQTPLFDISSTTIRRRIKEKKYVGHLIPKNVIDYIEKNKLYLS